MKLKLEEQRLYQVDSMLASMMAQQRESAELADKQMKMFFEMMMMKINH